MNLDLFLVYLANYSYWAIGIVLLLSSIGFPFPDELIMISVGYLAHLRLLNPYLAGIEIVILGLIIDNAYFFIGRYKGKSITKKLSTKYKFIDKIMKHNKSYELKSKKIFLARLVPVLRIIVPFLAGTSEIKWKKFLLYDAIALLVLTPFFIILSFHFSRYLSLWFNNDESLMGLVLLGIFLLGIVITIVKFLIRVYKKPDQSLDTN